MSDYIQRTIKVKHPDGRIERITITAHRDYMVEAIGNKLDALNYGKPPNKRVVLVTD